MCTSECVYYANMCTLANDSNSCLNLFVQGYPRVTQYSQDTDLRLKLVRMGDIEEEKNATLKFFNISEGWCCFAEG